MARPLPSGPQVTERSKSSVPESSNPTSTMDGLKKKKKKSRKSKHKERSSPDASTNGIESSAQQDAESPRPSKRKHESEHEHKKKKKKKKRHVAEENVNDASTPVVEDEQNQTAPSWSEDPASQEPPKPVHSTVNEAPVKMSSSQAESVGYETTGELTSKGRPKKQRGSRLGGKDNLKVGFFVPEEIERLERFKLTFCNTHGLSGEHFDMMVQHSEREGGEFPCPSIITSKSEFWRDIYGTIPDRDRRSVYRFMRRHFQVTTQKPHEWTDDQDEELVQLRAEHGPKWAFIAKLLGRSDDDVTQRWKNKLEHRDTMRRGPWGEDELRTFMEAMQQIWEGYRQMLHEGAGNDVYEMDERLVGWGGVSNNMGNVRSRQQCADKWRKIRKAVMAKRAKGFPDAVFDYTKAAKKREQPVEEPISIKSNEFVAEDEDEEDDDGNVGDNSLPTSAATTPAPKSRFADEEHEMAFAATTAKPTAEHPSLPQRDTETNAELELKVNGRSQELETPGNANGTTSPSTPVTPASASGGQKRDAGRMARIKEKIKEANKSSASKKRKRDEVTAEPEQDAENELPATDKQSEKERKKEKKRKKRERKEQAERERIEAEAEAAKAVTQHAAESEKKAKKHKNRKPTDGADDFEATVDSTPDKKKKKKHRKSESGAEVNGTQAEDAEISESQRKKDKKEKAKKKQAAREASDVTEQAPQESPAPAPVVDHDQAESDPDDSSDDDSIKLEGTESD